MSSEMQSKNAERSAGSTVRPDNSVAMELLQVRVDTLEAVVCDLQHQVTVLASKQAD